MPSVGCKEILLRIWEQQFRVTVKVLRSFPDNALDFTANERSRAPRSLACQCLLEEPVIPSIAEKALHDLQNVPPAPLKSIEEIVQAYARREASRQAGAPGTEGLKRQVTSMRKGGDRTMPQAHVFGAI
jgi:hypothetical protein